MVLVEITEQQCIDQIQKYRMLRRRELATNDDFAFGVLNSLVSTEEIGWSTCVGRLEADEIQILDAFLETEVRSCDFMPFPRSFMVDFNDEDLVEEKARELRPRYIAINDLILQAKEMNE